MWPFCLLKEDDVKTSNRLVNKLSVPDQTKQFIFAIQDSNSDRVVYILAAQNLSEQSAIDADHLIKSVRPDAVVVSVAPSVLPDIEAEDKLSNKSEINLIPTSYFGVLRRCLLDKVKKEQFDGFAGFQVMQAIFGIGFYGHFLAARRAAEIINSQFIFIESPYEAMNPSTNPQPGNEDSVIPFSSSSLLPGKATPTICSSSRRIFHANTLESDMLKSLGSSLDLPAPISSSDAVEERSAYEVPPFARTFYSLLADLYDIFNDIPAMGRALCSAKKMLVDVSEGETIDTERLAEVQNFRIAIEGLRMAFNKAARNPIDKSEIDSLRGMEFSELPFEEKCHVLFAQALKRHTEKAGRKTVVAVVDAASLVGVRKHWNTLVPPELANLAYCNDNTDISEELSSDQMETRRLLSDKPIVAIGAGATAVLGASSLSKAVPASSLIKIATFKLPASLKLGLLQLKRTASVGLSKIFVPSKLSTSSALKFTASTENIRAVAHSMVYTARRTSFFAIRTSFYELMRRRHVRPARFGPWATFGCSMGACASLLMLGDGIECAAESAPMVPTIASLGRGLQNLQQASEEVRGKSTKKIHKAIESMADYLKKR